MNAELTEMIEARAAKHAALADPARLRIVDLLTLGDVSPTDMSQQLGMPSNLVAHHLKVLEGVGILVRVRSEGDRRRSYLHLAPGSLSGLTPTSSVAGHRVVFVCTGNSARSQLAAALWASASSIPAASGGTHPAERVEPGAIRAAKRHHLNLQEATPQMLSDVLAPDDFVVTVCDNAHEELSVPSGLHWSIPDPVRLGTDAAFEAAFTDLEHRIQELAPRLAPA
ncbi:putative regulatory protein, ArsR family (plasmid) [Frondihabitans sucicola]|uniref:Regulatory protein, ArsR family n=1 Tax=Frondihabitans sucicola TaxID=1268041 RepID=A0ABM8GVT8_9MICO|nr:helix-turn-helix domain-containing protein [Frondihabitans sucicola]BDZ50506.1 putative regulatory protein, ArsR family [Frondihabitans sucicola]BDZ52589.1 putative regulatory protein, ArsR family [Frondihabitans sucicola]